MSGLGGLEMKRRHFMSRLGAAVMWPLTVGTVICASGITAAEVSPTSKPGQSGLHRMLHIRAIVGKEKRVYGHLRLSRGCVEGPLPDMTITKPPAIGTLSVRTEVVTLTDPNFGKCGPGHSGDGVVVYYKATAAGQDAFEYQMSSPGLPTTTWTVGVEVR